MTIRERLENILGLMLVVTVIAAAPIGVMLWVWGIHAVVEALK